MTTNEKRFSAQVRCFQYRTELREYMKLAFRDIWEWCSVCRELRLALETGANN